MVSTLVCRSLGQWFNSNFDKKNFDKHTDISEKNGSEVLTVIRIPLPLFITSACMYLCILFLYHI